MKFGNGLWEIVSAVFKWGTLIVGVMCFLIYSGSIGHFPEGIELGEGLVFGFISVGFMIAYAMFWLGVTAVGAIAMRWPVEWLQRAYRSVPEKAPAYLKTSLAPMWDPAVFIVAALAGLVGAVLVRGDLIRLWPFAAVALLQGFLTACILILKRRVEFDRTGLLIRKDEHEIERVSNRETRRRGAYVLLGLGLIAPALLLQGQIQLVDAAFRIAQLRKEHATIHVKTPWTQLFRDAGLREQASFLGTEYRSFTDVRVLLRSIGTMVVVEFPAKGKKPVNRGIPRDAVYVE